ncbi:MAG TPA: FtsQ-type POTRA domain-containing protein [bacterium]|nr:FtsQ-type POTRA domain-containing protein [bacterium]
MKQTIANVFSRFVLTIMLTGAVVFLPARYKTWIHESPTFRISEIQVSGNDYLSREELLEMAGLTAGMCIWNVDLRAADSLLRNHPFLDDVRLTRSLPRILRLEVREKEPLALLNFQSNLYCLDSKGLVLPSRPGKLYDLPVLSGPLEGAIKPGSRAESPWVMEGLDLLQLMLSDRPGLYNQISEILLGEEGPVLTTHHRAVPVYLGKGNRWKIRNLQAILDKLSKMEWQRVQYIDLRYEGQVVLGMRL